MLAEIGDRTLQAQCLSQLATSLAVREDQRSARLNAIIPAARRGQAIPARDSERLRSAPAASSAGIRTERFCLALLLRFPSLRDAAPDLSAESFSSTPQRQLFELWSANPDLSEPEIPEELRTEWDAAME